MSVMLRHAHYSIGRAGPPCPWRRADADPLCSGYLIGQQSGLAKANPLTMHNKTLIRTRCKRATVGPVRRSLIPPTNGPPERLRTRLGRGALQGAPAGPYLSATWVTRCGSAKA